MSRKQMNKKKRNDYDSDDDNFSKYDQMEVEEDIIEQKRLNKKIKKIKWQMCILQKQFLSFTNSFQYSTFIMIIQEKTKEFLEEISKEFNISMFIDIHKQYLKKIADLCFLSKKSENIFAIISNLLKQCCDFHALIQRLEAVETLDLNTMKGEITRIQQDFDTLSINFNRHNSLIINFLLKYEDKGLKQECKQQICTTLFIKFYLLYLKGVPLNQALDYNYFYVKEDDIKRIYGKSN